MKWTLELSDVPKDPEYPILGYSEWSPGVKGPENLFTVEQVINILANHNLGPENDVDDMREEMIISPILPEGTILYAKHPSGELEQVVFEIPQKTFEIRYKDTGVIHSLPFPRMVFMCELKNMGSKKMIDTMRIFAVANDKQQISFNTPLYDFPYPNVMKGSGTVCWGMNERIMIDSILEAKRALFLFFSAPFNEDHGVRTSHGINRFHKLLNELEDTPYSDDWLLPANKSFGQMLNESDY